MSHSHSCKADLPVTHFSPFITWLKTSAKTTLSGRVMGFVSGGGNIAVATAPTHLLCTVL